MARSSKSSKSSGPFILLDRDGVINEYFRDAYVSSLEDFRFIPGSLEAIRRLTDAGCRIVVVSNQAGIAKGVLDRKTLDAITQKMLDEVKKAGGRIADVLYCPHRPEDGCDCRKPKPGLLLQAGAKHKFDLSKTYFIGDNDADIQAAHAAGCKSILVLTGKSKAEEAAAWAIKPGVVERNLLEAVQKILGGVGSL